MNATTDIDWSIDVDPERTAVELGARDNRMQYVRRLDGRARFAGRVVG